MNKSSEIGGFNGASCSLRVVFRDCDTLFSNKNNVIDCHKNEIKDQNYLLVYYIDILLWLNQKSIRIKLHIMKINR